VEAVHAHPGLVAVRAGLPDKDGRREFSSGLLIAPRLVLTARHGVARNGVVLPGIDVSFVAGARGAVRLSPPVPGTVAWRGAGGLDVALIELAGGGDAAPDGFVPSRLIWGEPAGAGPVAVRVTGLPGFAADATGELAEVETARGELDPGTYTASDRYAVNLQAWPGTWQDWQGVSGAAITYAKGGYLVGVTAWSDKAFAGRRLTAVPVRALLADSGFRSVLKKHFERVPEVEPAELVSLLATPSRAGTPGALLRADAGVTEFTGRADELERLERWRDESAAHGPDVKALLITGRGGEGKTRLALELLERSKHDGWTGGVLKQSVSPDQVVVVAPPSRPLLLVIDYAAARAGGVAELLKELVLAGSSVPVRLLLIARTKGDWWSDLAAGLADDLPDLDGQVFPLGPLLADKAVPGESSASDRVAMFIATAAALAPQAARFIERTPGELRDIAARLTIPDLSGVRHGHVLTVQMSALVALLEEAEGRPAPAKSAEHVEDTLLRHEKRYRDKLAEAQPSLDALRPVRDRAVVGAVLFGARGPGEADARAAACAIVTAALPEVDRQASKQRTVAKWIAGLYPPDEPEPGAATEYWGEVLPDRLGEFLAARLLAAEETTQDRDESLLASLAVHSELTGIGRALLTLSRAVDHDPRSSDWIIRLVAADPMNTGRAALLVASYAENPTPLRAALVRLGHRSPEQLREAAASVHDALPEFSVQALESSTALTREIVNVLSELASHQREAWLPTLAKYLASLAGRLTDARRNEEALDISDQAFNAYTELAAADREAYLPELAQVLERHSERLARAGWSVEADEISAQAQQAYDELIAAGRIPAITNAGPIEDSPSAESRDRAARAFQRLIELAAADPRHLPYLVQGAGIHLAGLAEAERKAEALYNYGKVVEILAEHAAANRDVYLPDLATAAFNHATRLAEAGQYAEALRASDQALRAFGELAGVNRDVYLPDLAAALVNHALRLSEVGQHAEALGISAQGLRAFDELAAADRDAHLPDLAKALVNHALRLSEVGQHAEALGISAQGLRAFDELAAADRDTHLPSLAKAARHHAERLSEVGQHAEALGIYAQALQAYDELAAADRNYLPSLAEAAYHHAERLAEAGQHAEALRASAQALRAFDELAAADRKYLNNLAAAAYQHALRLTGAGQHADALRASAQAVRVFDELAAADRDTHLTHLTGALALNGLVLVRCGRVADAVGVLVRGLSIVEQLPEDSSEWLGRSMVRFLREAYDADPRQTEAAFRDATGEGLPEMPR
jgi:hypothetical protein